MSKVSESKPENKATPLLGAGGRKLGIEKAAWMLEDATQNIPPDIVYPEELLQARMDFFEVLKSEKLCSRGVFGLVMVTVFEVPSWCLTSVNVWSFMPGEDRCPSPDGSTLYLSGISYVPPGFSIMIEAVCVFLILRKFILEHELETKYFKTTDTCYRDFRIIHFGMAMAFLHIIDTIVYAIWRPNFRIAFIARFGFMCLLPAVRSLGHCVVAVLNEFISVAVFLVSTMVFFAWIAVTIFDDIKDVNEEGEPVNKGLDTFGAACYTMFVAGTTDDFVDAFLPTFVAYRQAGILWLIFLVIVQLLFLNLVLDTLVAAYTKFSESKSEEQFQSQVKGIINSFKSLSGAVCPPGESEISKQDFIDFCMAVSKSPRMPTLTEDTAAIMFQALDTDGSGFMSQHEFCDICGVFSYSFWVTKKNSMLETFAPGFWNSAKFSKFRAAVWDGTFDQFMNCILGLNFILVIVESVYDLHNWPEPPTMSQLDIVFSLSYAVEVFCKLSVYSFEEYWSETSNQFDFWTTWLLLSTCLLQGVLSRYANLLRLLRLLRVLKQLKTLKSVQFMISTIQQLVITSKDILTLLGVVVFFFTSLGVQAFGGLLYDGNEKLKGSEYLEDKQSVLNFNDVPMGFSLWFVMLLCEYVANFADAVDRTSAIPGAWLVFPIFYVCAVSIVFELVKAFTIEVFIDLHEKKDEEPEPDFEGVEEICAEFDARDEALHWKAIGDTSKREKLKDAYKEFLEEEEEHNGHGGHHALHGAHGQHGHIEHEH